jgi:hypothetical protein
VHNFEIDKFSLTEYGAENFKNFIKDLIFDEDNALNGPMDYPSAMLFGLAVAEGVREWNEFKDNYLRPYYIIQAVSAQIIESLSLFQAEPEQIAKIIFRVLECLNGRSPVPAKGELVKGYKYNATVRTMGELFAKIQAGKWNEDTSLADCKPLTILMYLTMSSIGIKTSIHLGKGFNKDKKIIEGHVHTTVKQTDGKEKPFDNTKIFDINNIELQLFDDRTLTDFWPLIAEAFLYYMGDGDQDTLEMLQQIMILDPKSSVGSIRIVEQYVKMTKTKEKLLENPNYLKDAIEKLGRSIDIYYKAYTDKTITNLRLKEKIYSNLELWKGAFEYFFYFWRKQGYTAEQLSLSKQEINSLLSLKNLFLPE